MLHFDWIVFFLTMALLAIFLTLSSRQSRQYVFLTICLIGAAAGTYGFILFAQTKTETSFLKGMGLPLALIVVITLCFAALTLNLTFDYQQLRKWAYPSLCFWFVMWIGSQMGLAAWVILTSDRHVALIAIKYFGLIGVDFSSRTIVVFDYWVWIHSSFIFLGFLLSLVSRCNLRRFQVLFPLCSVSLLISFVAMYRNRMAGIFPPGFPASEAQLLQTDAFLLLRHVFFFYNWILFFLIAYFYINTKYHSEHLQQYPFVRKLPTGAVFLVAISFFDEFPEYAHFRDAFPMGSETFESVLMVLDISMILVMTWVAVFGKLVRETRREPSENTKIWS